MNDSSTPHHNRPGRARSWRAVAAVVAALTVSACGPLSSEADPVEQPGVAVVEGADGTAAGDGTGDATGGLASGGADEASGASGPTDDDWVGFTELADVAAVAALDPRAVTDGTALVSPKCTVAPGYAVSIAHLPDVVIDPVVTAEVKAQPVTANGETVPGFDLPSSTIPGALIDGGCVITYDASPGCLPAVEITPVVIPGAEVPEVTVPAVTIGGVTYRDEEIAPGESALPVRVEGAYARGGCQQKPAPGERAPSVRRDSLTRDWANRGSIFRSSLYVPAVFEDDFSIDSLSVPSVNVPSVSIDRVYLESASLDATTLEDAPDVAVVDDGEETSYIAEADVLFDFDSSTLRPEADGSLRSIAAAIAVDAPTGVVSVQGFTDSKGDDAYNLELSRQRAQAVADWLVADGGITADRLEVIGLGETLPFAPNEKPDGSDNPAGRELNRRVVVSVASN
ncbi:MAG: OmpA family protein [Acidimicrobiales bacterium]